MRGISAAIAAGLFVFAPRAGFARDRAGAALHVQVTVRSDAARVETRDRSVTISGAGAARRVLALDHVSGALPSGSPEDPRVSWTTEADGARRVTIDF